MWHGVTTIDLQFSNAADRPAPAAQSLCVGQGYSGWEGLSQSEWVTSSFRFLNSLKHLGTPPLCDINIRALRSCKIWDNNNNNTTTRLSIMDTVDVRMPTGNSEKDGEHHVLFGGSPIQRIPAIRNILPKFLVPLPIHILYCLTAASKVLSIYIYTSLRTSYCYKILIKRRTPVPRSPPRSRRSQHYIHSPL